MTDTERKTLTAIIETQDADIQSMQVFDVMALAVALQKQVKALAQYILDNDSNS